MGLGQGVFSTWDRVYFVNGTGSILYIGWGQLCVEDRVCLESVGVHLNGIIFFFYKPGPTIIETHTHTHTHIYIYIYIYIFIYLFIYTFQSLTGGLG